MSKSQCQIADALRAVIDFKIMWVGLSPAKPNKNAAENLALDKPSIHGFILVERPLNF
jgi:hypothetical protein